MTFDLVTMVSDVEGAEPLTPERPWLAASVADPAAFYTALFAATLGARLTRSKSAPYQGYELYGDTVARYAAEGRTALCWYDPDEGLRELSYAACHERAGLLAGRWASLGVAPGDAVTVLSALPDDQLVAFCAALRLGLCVSVLPVMGPAALQRRLAALAPAHVAADRLYQPLLRDLGLSRIPVRAGDGAAAPPPRLHTYGAREPLLTCYSPLAAPDAAVQSLSADQAVLPALRDGALLLGLRPGDVLAAPGYDPSQHLPLFLLCTLLSGATFAHLALSQIAARPGLLPTLAPRCLGITPALRDLLNQAPAGALRGVQRWFRDPAEPFEPEPWQRLLAHQGLGQVPGSNLHFDDRAGGCVLFSPRRRGAVHQEVLPAPGCGAPLLDLSLSGQPARGRIAVFTGNTVLYRTTSGFLYGAPLAPRRSGRVYPSDEVVAALAGLPFLRGATVVPVDGRSGAPCFSLLAFTGDSRPGEDGAMVGEIQERIRAALGDDFMPDHIELYPLFPRQSAGQVDQAFCQVQHLRGMLHRKARRPVFRILTSLRAALAAPAAVDAPPARRP